MKKTYLIVSILIILFLIAGGAYFFRDEINISLPWNADKLSNAEQIFSIKEPDNFDEFRRNRLQEKINQAKQLYTEKPNDTWTWITIGNMYEYAKDYDRAILAYKKGASLNAGEYISRLNLAYIYENQKKDFVSAERYYKEVLSLISTNPDSYINLAKLYNLKMQKKDLAEKIYLDGLIKTNNNPDLLIEVINFYRNNNNLENASKYAKILVKNFPDDARYQTDFADLLK